MKYINIDLNGNYSAAANQTRLLVAYLCLFKKHKHMSWDDVAVFLGTTRKTLWKIRNLKTNIRPSTFNTFMARLVSSGCPAPNGFVIGREENSTDICCEYNPDCPFIGIFYEIKQLREEHRTTIRK